MTAETPTAQAEAEKLLEELSSIVTKLERINGDRKAAHAQVEASYNQQSDPLMERRDAIVDTLKELYETHKAVLTKRGKTAFLRSGELSTRSRPAAVTVVDEKLALKDLRAKGWLRRFTRIGKRTLDKLALKRDPERARQVKGIRVEGGEQFRVVLKSPQQELVRDYDPLTRKL